MSVGLFTEAGSGSETSRGGAVDEEGEGTGTTTPEVSVSSSGKASNVPDAHGVGAARHNELAVRGHPVRDLVQRGDDLGGVGLLEERGEWVVTAVSSVELLSHRRKVGW